MAKFDPTDIPAVTASDLALVMRHLIATERGLALLNGLDAKGWRDVDNAIWQIEGWSSAQRQAVSLRMRALLDVFVARRLKSLLLATGFRTLGAAMRAAATLRLNAAHGFRPQAMLQAMRAVLEDTSVRIAGQEGIERLAA